MIEISEMTASKEQKKALIVGAGQGGSALLELLAGEALGIVGIVDTNPNANGLRLASERHIPIFTDVEAALRESGATIVFDMTHDESVSELAAQYVGAANVIGGQVARIFYLMIFRQQAVEKELLKNQALLQSVINNVKEGIVSINTNGIVESANPAILDVFGYQPEELMGRNISMLMPEPVRSMHDTFLRNYMRTGEKHVIGSYREVIGLHKDGNQFPLELNVAEMVLDGVKHFVGLARDITGRKAAEDKLTQLALYDQLTGLPNRTMFYEKLGFSLSQAKRIKCSAALLFIDLDGFKAVNDCLGHDMGDRVLKEVGQRLQSCIRASDTVARMGGDEFTVILNNLQDPKQASSIARKIINVISEAVDLNGKHCEIGASIGIAIYPSSASNIDDLVKVADTAMYDVKARGKNAYKMA